MPLLRREPGTENKSARGAYVLLEAEGGTRKLTIMSTGSELHLAVEAREILQKEGIPTAVVSMPCRLLFEEQDAAYRKAVLGETQPALPWKRRSSWAGIAISASRAASSACTGFGESGKIADVYAKFDITTDAVVRAARETLAEVNG